jgi:predicted small lipoprotein YifL
MRAFVVSLVLASAGLLAGCGSSAPAPVPPSPIAAEPDGPITIEREPDERRDEVPRSVRRLVAEQRVRLDECSSLAEVVGDRLGRARARSETSALVERLATIERALREWKDGNGDSDRLDGIVDELRRNATRVALLHEALRSAAQ